MHVALEYDPSVQNCAMTASSDSVESPEMVAVHL